MRKGLTTESDESRDALARIKNAVDAYQNAPAKRTISAMDVLVSYIAIVGRVEHLKRGEEHVFRITRHFLDSRQGEKWEEKHLNAYAVRDEFLKVKEWSEALVFLETTGIFSPLGDSITWSDFQRWQRFVYLVQEHNALAEAMQNRETSGELGDVLSDLTGFYPNSFFHAPPLPESDFDARLTKDPEFGPMIQEATRKLEARQERQLRELCSWFREPPEKAFSIQWVPISDLDNRTVWLRLRESGAILQFLLPQSALRPYLLIQPRCTLEAIAAAIYADRIHGVEYRACEMCKALFKLGAHREKKYCDRKLCKNRAHQRNRRAAVRKRAGASTETREGGKK